MRESAFCFIDNVKNFVKAMMVRMVFAFRRKSSEGSCDGGINIIGFFSGEGGLATAAKNLRDAALASGIPVAAIDIRRVPKRGISFAGIAPYATTMVVANPDILFDAVRGGMMRYLSGKRIVAHWTWETERAPWHWKSYATLFDEIMAPSLFAAHAIHMATRRKVQVVPYPVVVPVQEVSDRSVFGIPEAAFVFLCMADGRSGLDRKNPFGTIAAFRNAFGDRTDVFLLVKVMHVADADITLLREAATANVMIMDRVLSDDERMSLLCVCDAFVSLHMGEGFGFVMAEAMLLGKPVIATEYGGNTDFMSEESSYLVRGVSAFSEARGAYARGTVWCKPDLQQAAEYMRLTIDDSDLRQKKSMQAQADIGQLLDLKVIGERIKAVLGQSS